MSFSYDVTTDRGKVRLLCTDTNGGAATFHDDEIDTFLSLESGNVRRAAALALETIASNEVLVQKRILLLELSTDGPDEAQALMARAKALREQADRDDQAQDGGAFDVAEWVVDDFSFRDRLAKEAQRAQE